MSHDDALLAEEARGDPKLTLSKKDIGNYVNLTFAGVQIKFYGVLDPGHGIGAVSLDGSNETMIDFYAASCAGNQLLWTSPMVSAGTHTFKFRVTGK